MDEMLIILEPLLRLIRKDGDFLTGESLLLDFNFSVGLSVCHLAHAHQSESGSKSDQTFQHVSLPYPVTSDTADFAHGVQTLFLSNPTWLVTVV